MENQGNNGICPNCGMYLNDGVCPECGYSAAAEGAGFENEQIGEIPVRTETEAQTDAPAGNDVAAVESETGVADDIRTDNADTSNNDQQDDADQSNGYPQDNVDVNGSYQPNAANVNGGYYQPSGANQNGYYQQGGPNVSGGYQPGEANANGGYYQPNGANQNGYYQQGGPNVSGGYQPGEANANGGYYQQGGTNQNGYYQQGGPNVSGGYQSGETNANGGYYQPNGANQNGYYQQGGTNQNGYYQQSGPNVSGGYQPNGANANGGYYQQGGANQNGYYQNPQGQNGYNGYNPGQPPQKNGSKGAIIAAVVGGLLLLILVIALIVVVSMGLNNTKDSRTDDRHSVERESDNDDQDDDLHSRDDKDDDKDDDKNNDKDDDDDDWFSDFDDDYDPMEFLNDIDWDDESWKKEPYNYDPEDVGDEFYYEICNCIDESVDYEINFETFEDTDESDNICMRIRYYQLEGDIPNLEDINETLKETAMRYNTYYNDNIDNYEEMFEEYGSGFVVKVDTYVTYNDDEKISIVMNQYYESPLELDKDIVSFNIDLEAGIILNNTDFFDISDDFLDYYRDTCRDQNGSVPALKYFDNDEIKVFFEDEDELILFYTPCGYEVGINYETDDSYGWVTATLVDCEQYLQSY